MWIPDFQSFGIKDLEMVGHTEIEPVLPVSNHPRKVAM
jgi:hypothetical protein